MITGRVPALLLVGAVPLIVLGTIVPGSVLAVLGGWLLFVALLIVVDIVAAASPRRVALERQTAPAVRLGQPVDVTLLVTNLGARRIQGLVRDGWQPSAGAARSRWPLDVPAGERRAVTTTLTPSRRGDRLSEQVTVRSVGPLGVAGRQATLASPGRVRVLPPFNSRRHLPSRLARLRELDGRTALQIRGPGTEFDSIREYVRGDDVRSIDWRVTARSGELPGAGRKLMVRTWRPERDRRIVLVVDAGRASAARIDDEPRLDTAFEACLLLTALATRAGDRVDLIVWDRRIRARVLGAAPSEVLARMVDAMAPIEPELLETDWAQVPAQIQAITSQRALIVLLTPLEGAGSARGLLGVLPALTQRHTVVVAGVTDPEVLAMTTRRGTRDDVFLAAAAERSLLDTARLASAARQLGADVLTASPQQLPAALADRYLALKAAGRL